MVTASRDIEIHIDRIDLASAPAGGERRLREAVARAFADAGPAGFGRPESGDNGEIARRAGEILGGAVDHPFVQGRWAIRPPQARR